MAKAKKLPSGSWRCQVYAGMQNGKRQYKSFTAATKKEAELLAAQYSIQTDRSSDEKNVLLSEAMKRYNEERKYTLSPRTVKEYDGYRKSAYKDIENLPLSKIDQKVIQKWVNNCAKKNSPKTVKNKYAFLISFLKSYDIDIKCTIPKKRPVQYHIVTNEEFTNLLKESNDTPIGLAIKLATFIPARREEICAINPRTDIKGNLLTINKAIVKNEYNQWVVSDTKTYKSTRTVEMPPQIIELLKSVPLEHNPDKLYRDFKRVAKKLGYDDMRFHDLRHYGATLLHDQLVPDKEIMHRGGWSSLSTLMNIYVHYNPDTAKTAAKVTNALYDSFME